MSVVKKDVELLAMLLHSLPPIFRNKGTPNDLNFILSHLKQAVVYRGVSSDVQKLLIDLLVPFSKFKAGFIGVRELNTTFQEATSAILRPTRPVKKVSSLPELKCLAVLLHHYSRDKSLEQSPQVCPDNEAENQSRVTYSRDVLLKLKQTSDGYAPYDLLKPLSLCKLSSRKITSSPLSSANSSSTSILHTSSLFSDTCSVDPRDMASCTGDTLPPSDAVTISNHINPSATSSPHVNPASLSQPTNPESSGTPPTETLESHHSRWGVVTPPPQTDSCVQVTEEDWCEMATHVCSTGSWVPIKRTDSE